MKHTLDGVPVYLRTLEESDITDRYVGWFDDHQITMYLETKKLTKKDAIDHLLRGQESGNFCIYAIVLSDTGKHVGNVKIGELNNPHGVSSLNTLIGEKSAWGKGIGTAAIRIGTDLAFEQRDIRKLSSGIYGQNTASIKAYTNAGWIIEGRLIGHYIMNGEVTDRVMVSCFNCRYFELVDGRFVQR